MIPGKQEQCIGYGYQELEYIMQDKNRLVKKTSDDHIVFRLCGHKQRGACKKNNSCKFSNLAGAPEEAQQVTMKACKPFYIYKGM